MDRNGMSIAPSKTVEPSPVSMELAEVFGVLSDPTRIEMLRLLAASEEVACTTFDALFPISKSTISYHVKALRQAGLIRVRKEGKYYHYTLLADEVERRLPGLIALVAPGVSPQAQTSSPFALGYKPSAS
jgi:DNA-binding transcriptional ArsR family regulator